MTKFVNTCPYVDYNERASPTVVGAILEKIAYSTLARVVRPSLSTEKRLRAFLAGMFHELSAARPDTELAAPPSALLPSTDVCPTYIASRSDHFFVNPKKHRKNNQFQRNSHFKGVCEGVKKIMNAG